MSMNAKNVAIVAVIALAAVAVANRVPMIGNVVFDKK